MPDVANRPVTSREYKLMLNVDRFADRGAGAQTFWAVVEFLAKNGGGTAKAQNEEELRKTWYLDTPGHELAMRGYSLRIRKEESGHKLTLKLRSPDRYLAAAERVEAKGEATAKFEEDILRRRRVARSRAGRPPYTVNGWRGVAGCRRGEVAKASDSWALWQFTR